MTEEKRHKEHKETVKERALENRLAAAEERCQEYLNDLKRLQAEFENYRKRAQREQAELMSSAAAHLVKRLLPVVDDLDRALGAAEEHAGNEHLLDGLKLVQTHFMKVLEDEGVIRIEAGGEQFDPRLHEAVMGVASNDAAEGEVVEVVRSGYLLGDKVLRTALVKVAHGA